MKWDLVFNTSLDIKGGKSDPEGKVLQDSLVEVLKKYLKPGEDSLDLSVYMTYSSNPGGPEEAPSEDRDIVEIDIDNAPIEDDIEAEIWELFTDEIYGVVFEGNDDEDRS